MHVELVIVELSEELVVSEDDVELVRLVQLLIDVALERSVSFTGHEALKIASGDYTCRGSSVCYQ